MMLRERVLERDLEGEYLERLKGEIMAAPRLAAWGTGRGAAKLLDLIKKLEWGGELRFIDSNEAKCAGPYRGCEVVSPRAYFGSGYDPGVPILITCADVDGVRRTLESCGCRSRVVVSDLTSVDLDAGESWHSYIWRHMDDFSEAYEMMADEKSRDVLAGLLNYRISRDERHLDGMVDDMGRMYLEEDLYPVGGLTIADCGAYVGDTVEAFIRGTGGDYGKIYAFEPDPKIYARLVENIARNGWERVEAHNLGCHSGRATLRFESGGSGMEMCNHLSESGNSSVEVDSLDNVIRGGVGLIKMDIEGAECDALRGCRRLIRECRPVLAICLYHKREDYYAIPRLVRELNPEYRLYVRQYAHTDNETLLYAV